MKKLFILLVIAVCWLLLVRLQSQERDNLQSYQLLYNRAEALFNGMASDSTDSVAINYYTRIIAQLTPAASNDTLLYNCYERRGILKQGLDYYSSADILEDYHKAIQVQQYYHLGDSILFRLLLSAGNVHYTNGLFDSSEYYFTKAERIINRYPGAGLAGDLYNSLGALYSEMGNYVQSGIYFSKALELTRQQHPELKDAIFSMSANIAFAVQSSGRPDSALYLYKQLLTAGRHPLAIIKSISEIYLTKQEPDSALQYLQMAKTIEGNHAIATLNAFAKAFMLKEDTTQAASYLRAATDFYTIHTPGVKSNQSAATQRYFGDLRMMEKKPEAALIHYQQAIIQSHFKFNDSDVFANPANFIGDFASYSLFDALTAKAACFATLYTQTKTDKYFNATVSTYDAAFLLSDYIKKSIDNDEARLFVADKVFNAYLTAVDFLMNAGQPGEEQTIHALEWISKSRATSLAISLKENTIKQYAALPDSLLQKEKNAKIGISRLKLQLQQSSDAAEQERLVSAINTASLQLQAIDNRFKEYPNYYHQKFAADSIDIPAIQNEVLNNKTAAICYFKGAGKLYAFVIKHNKIVTHSISSDTVLDNNIAAYTQQLTGNTAGKMYNEKAALYIHSKLVQPLAKDMQGITSLIILPDQNLINVPFEALQPASNQYLVEDYAVTYQYALPFLQKNNLQFDKNKGVAFAPFATENRNATLNVLPYSINEIAHFSSNAQLINKAATKHQFITKAGEASVIHLATHAAVDFEDPEDSYIAFYNAGKADSSYKVYAHELYNMELPNTKLVFLSACETGSGKLSRSEGALSISRAFAFAGCPNIVTSLWKAEDKTTAYISEHFYKYVESGDTYAQALQKAKKDLLADETMSQLHAPAYWSHLIFIGDVQEEHSTMWWWVAIAGGMAAAGLIFIYKQKNS